MPAGTQQVQPVAQEVETAAYGGAGAGGLSCRLPGSVQSGQGDARRGQACGGGTLGEVGPAGQPFRHLPQTAGGADDSGLIECREDRGHEGEAAGAGQGQQTVSEQHAGQRLGGRPGAQAEGAGRAVAAPQASAAEAAAVAQRDERAGAEQRRVAGAHQRGRRVEGRSGVGKAARHVTARRAPGRAGRRGGDRAAPPPP